MTFTAFVLFRFFGENRLTENKNNFLLTSLGIFLKNRIQAAVKNYNEVENFNIYGNERFIYQYISEKYPEVEVKFDIEQIKLTTIDIEVKSEYGFPDVESAAEEILLITLQDYTTKQIRTWGLGLSLIHI